MFVLLVKASKDIKIRKQAQVHFCFIVNKKLWFYLLL